MGSVVIVLWFVVCILIMYFVAKEFARIAAMKGHKEKRYFWWTFLAGPVGVAMVIALPNSFYNTVQAVASEALPDV